MRFNVRRRHAISRLMYLGTFDITINYYRLTTIIFDSFCTLSFMKRNLRQTSHFVSHCKITRLKRAKLPAKPRFVNTPDLSSFKTKIRNKLGYFRTLIRPRQALHAVWCIQLYLNACDLANVFSEAAKPAHEFRLLRDLMKEYDQAARPVISNSDVVLVKMGVALFQIRELVSEINSFI